MSFKNCEESDYGLSLDLLTISYSQSTMSIEQLTTVM